MWVSEALALKQRMQQKIPSPFFRNQKNGKNNKISIRKKKKTAIGDVRKIGIGFKRHLR